MINFVQITTKAIDQKTSKSIPGIPIYMKTKPTERKIGNVRFTMTDRKHPHFFTAEYQTGKQFTKSSVYLNMHLKKTHRHEYRSFSEADLEGRYKGSQLSPIQPLVENFKQKMSFSAI